MPYRLAVESEDLETRAELVLDLSSLSARTPFDRALISSMSGVAASIVVASAGFPVVAAGVLAFTGTVVTWRWRHPPGPALFSVVVDRGALTISRGKTTLIRSRIVELEAVTLDTRTIRTVIAGNQPTPAVTHTNLSPELDQSRVIFKFAGREVPVTHSHVAHYLALEWIGKTRAFLRANGWVPEDERP